MKAFVFIDKQRIELQERPRPEVHSGEVLVKVEYCGICGSDVHGYLNGIMISRGVVPGHECCGVVAKVGDEVKNFQPGDRVVVKPIAQCGKCYWCQRGEYSLCPIGSKQALGISPNCDGGYAEYVRVPHPNEMLYKLPPQVTFEQAALVDPLATSLHAIRMSRFKPGDRVLIIGAGMIGLAALQFLQLGGAGKIVVLEISEKRSHIARELGADIVLKPNSDGKQLRKSILDITDEIGPDIVFDCAGVPFSFQNSLYFVKRGGQVIVVGVNEEDVPISNYTMVLREIEMKGVVGYYDEFKYVIEFLEKGKINTEVLISDIIPLGDLDEKGFKRLIASRDDIKILVRP